MRKNISFIVNTVNSCNLRCTYCYAPKVGLDQIETIPEEILTKLIVGAADLGIQNVQFVWHGSEPTLAGRGFFQRALQLQQEYGKPWQSFDNVMQTNGTLLDKEWLTFFQDNGFGVGVSIDGPASIHDKCRPRVGGAKTHQTVHSNWQKLRSQKCDGGICAVVSQGSLGHAEEIVDYFYELGVPELDFLQCFPVENHILSGEKSEAISAHEYGAFMIEAFDRWWELDDPNFQIRTFENIIVLLLGGQSGFCKFRPDKCHEFLGIDTTGDVYPCDLFVGHTDWKLGSLATHDLKTIISGDRYRRFLGAMQTLDEDCYSCPWLQICWGGCTYHRYLADKDICGKTVYCESRQRLFSHVADAVGASPPFSKARPLAGSTSCDKLSELYVNLGAACNSSCYFCAADSTIDAPVIRDSFLPALANARNAGVNNLIISGGEPTVYLDLVEFIFKAKQMGFERIHLQTNGRRLGRLKYLEQILNAGVDEFGLSLHGTTPIMHDRISNSPGSFAQTVQALENFNILMGPTFPVAVNCVITPENKNHLAALVRFLIDYNVSTIKLSYLHGIGRASQFFKRPDWPKKSEIQTYLVNAISTVESLGKPNTTLAIEAYPACLLPGYEQYSSDSCIQSVMLAQLNGTLTSYHTKENRIKGKPCLTCKLNSSCLGPWKEYVDVFGWSEFESLV